MNEQNVGMEPFPLDSKEGKLRLLSNKGYYLSQLKEALTILSANPPQLNMFSQDQFRLITDAIRNHDMQDCADMVHVLVVGCLKKKHDALEKELHDLIK